MNLDKIARQRRPKCNLVDRDDDIFHFLWKWKCASTSTLARKFFKNGSRDAAYKRLVLLHRDKYIDIEVIEKNKYALVWTLREKGYLHIEQRIKNLAVSGFASESLFHDHLVSAFHLGEWLKYPPEFTRVFTEQQLRRVAPDNWPDWLPHSQEHRPDGYSMYFVGTKQVVVAFEVELNVKAHARYDTVVEFYDNKKNISFVFWLVESKSDLASIKKAFQSFGVRDWSKHHFIYLDDFRKNGWDAKFVEGKHHRTTPAKFLNPNGVSRLSLESPVRETGHLLNLEKKPMNLSPSVDIKK